MFLIKINIMLYVDDVAKEKAFWNAIGFNIITSSEMMGFETFDMTQHEESSIILTVFDKEFIRQFSPEVLNNVPSILFETDDIYALHEKVAAHTNTCSPVQSEPFLTFNFASPSGIYFAVKGQQ